MEKLKKPKTGYEAVMQLDAVLRASRRRNYKCVAWAKVKASQLAAVEKKLGVKLPPSYRAFVLQHGIFCISGDDEDNYDKVDSQYYRLVPPRFILTATLGIRRYRRHEDDEELVNDAIMFQSNPYDEDFFAFRISSRRKDGEMTVGEWHDHNDGFWPRGFTSFDAHLIELCDGILKKVRK